jgi:F1F0 ATPase subunit 2
MSDLPILILMFTGGAVLGAAYLAVLWFAVRRMHTHPPSALAVAASLIARMAIVVAGFYVVLAAGDWRYLLAALSGFVVLRTLVVRRVRRGLSQAGVEKRRPA